MTAVIFGANGQDGFYLSRALMERNIGVVKVSRTGDGLKGDVSDFSFTERLIRSKQPRIIFHLAAESSTRHQTIFDNHNTIAGGVLNVLESVKRHCPDCKVFVTGSGLQFRNSGQAISENDAFEATSPYSLARIHSAFAARYYRSVGIAAYVGYLFHHESPLRKEGHVSQIIARAASEISLGQRDELELGDIRVEKEWAFAGDIVEGILTLISQDEIFEATIGSGQAYAIEDWLAACFGHAGLDWRDHVRISEDFEAEYPRLVCDPSTINSLGWQPKVSLSELAVMMVDSQN